MAAVAASSARTRSAAASANALLACAAIASAVAAWRAAARDAPPAPCLPRGPAGLAGLAGLAGWPSAGTTGTMSWTARAMLPLAPLPGDHSPSRSLPPAPCAGLCSRRSARPSSSDALRRTRSLAPPAYPKAVCPVEGGPRTLSRGTWPVNGKPQDVVVAGSTASLHVVDRPSHGSARSGSEREAQACRSGWCAAASARPGCRWTRRRCGWRPQGCRLRARCSCEARGTRGCPSRSRGPSRTRR